jgi:TPP-dependent indolepyruvate ferredoxin oxidoreductase alpha subunit
MKIATTLAIIAALGLNVPTADAAISSNRHGHAAGLVALVSSAHLLKSAEAVS